MKLNFNKKYITIGIIAFLVIVCSILFFFMAFKMDSFVETVSSIYGIIEPFVFGFIIAYLFIPIVNFFEQKILFPVTIKKTGDLTIKQKKRFRVYSVILTYMLIILLIYFFVKSIAPDLGQSINRIILYYPQYYASLLEWFDKILRNNPQLYKNAMQLIGTYSEDINEMISGTILPQAKEWLLSLSFGVYGAIKSVWNLVMGLIISVYVLFIKEKFAGQAKKIIYAICSKDRANRFLKDVRFVSDTFIGFISGKILDSFIIGILCFIGCSILNIPYSLLVSVIVGVTNIIPFFGPIIGAIPSALLILMVDPWKCVTFIIFVIILQQLDGNVIGPKILGDSTGISGFWVIFAIMFFGGLWGPGGMIIGIPFFAVIYAMIKRSVDRKLKAKNLPTETADYMPLKRIEANGDFTLLAEASNEFYVSKDKCNKKTSFFSKFVNKHEINANDDSDE